MAPLLFLAGLSVHNHIEAARRSLYLDAQHMADNLTANFEREMASVITLLNVLAQDTAFDRGEYTALYQRAKEGLKGRRGFVAAFGLEPKPLFSTRFPYGAPLPAPADDGASAQVMASGRPLVSNLFYGPVVQRSLFNLIVPIIRDDKVVGRMHLALEPKDLTDTILPVGMERSWGFSIADRNAIYVASSDPGSYQAGQPVQRALLTMMRADAGQFRVETENGEPLLIAYRKSPLFGWTAFATMPVAVVEQPLSQVWDKFAFIALSALTISLLAAHRCSRAMARPIQQLTGAAMAFGEGQDIPSLHSTLREANLLSGALSKAAMQLHGRTAALAESERRFRLFAEQTPDVIWFVDLDRRSIDYVSPAFEEISGLTSNQIADMSSWRGAVHPDDLAEFDRRFAGSLQDSAESEYRICRPDGVVKWVRDMRFPLEITDGKPRIVAGILRDITTRREAVLAMKAAQAEAEANAEELESLYSSAPVGLAFMDTAFRISRLNASLAKRGRGPEAFTGLPFFEAFPELEAGARSYCAEVLTTGIPVKNIELEVLNRNKTDPNYLLASFYPVRLKDGAVSGIGAILEDITDRKRTEQVLDRLAAIVYAANDAMFSLTPTGHIQNWNPAAQSLFQHTQAEAVSRDLASLFSAASDEDYRQLRQAWNVGESMRLNTQLRRKDGSIFEASVSIAPIREAERIIAVSTTIEDISERRRSERRQLLMNRELSHRVKNTLAVIQSMARHTLRSSPDPAAFMAAFEGRLRALAISHNLLTSSEWEGAEMRDLASEQLAAYTGAGGQVQVDGPRLLIPPGMVTSLGLVLHEMGSNAAKFGALSLPGGSVRLHWEVLPAFPHKTLRIEWTEEGGPAAEPPLRKGFGSLLMENTGKVEQHFAPQGLRCTVEMPLMEQVPSRPF